MSRVKGALALTAWLSALLVAVVVLRALGHGDLATPPTTAGWHAFHAWLGRRDAGAAVMAALRLVSEGLAAYLLAVSTLGAVARTTNAARAVRLADALTVPAVRRLLTATAGIAIAAIPIAANPIAATPIAPIGPALAEPGTSHAAMDTPPTLQRLDDVAPAPAQPSSITAAPVPPAQPAGVTAAPARPPPLHDTWTVRPSDSLWLIAHASWEAAKGRAPTDDELGPYWLELIEANRANLVTDDPNLIYAGQQMVVPPVP